MTPGLLPFRESHPSLRLSRAGAAAAVCILSTTCPADGARISEAVQDCVSIVVAALPYVVAGTLAASSLRRFLSSECAHPKSLAVLVALCNPGCDCALNGYADALARATAPVAGFVLTFAAIASPLALAMTCAVFGVRVAVMRAAGAALSAGLTAFALRFVSIGGSARGSDCSRESHAPATVASQLTSALSGILISAILAAGAKALVPASFFTHVPYGGAAAMALIFSPCSSADPLMAAALLRDPHSQMAFMLCAQGAGLRQLMLLARTFGPARAIAAAACSGIACALIIAVS
ncbi:MAG TPA: hypothetical protein VKT51_03540 [Candidatus Eremiobacteraceae bacterium]|nr:hypothetical protein [Candidatus Eremiobacteraceae bacterium]